MRSFLTASLFAIGIVAAGCGGSSSSDSTLTTVCNQYCAKCNTAGAGLATVGFCANCSGFSGSTSKCTNESAIASAVQSCANMSTCSASETCFETGIPDCAGSSNGGTGTGGTSGTGTGGHASTGSGGSSGIGGSSGTADCSACDKFVSSGCCAAFLTMEGDSSAGSDCAPLQSACSSTGSSAVSTCQQGLTAGAALNIAACK